MKPHKICSKTLICCQSGEISPNLVTLFTSVFEAPFRCLLFHSLDIPISFVFSFLSKYWDNFLKTVFFSEIFICHSNVSFEVLVLLCNGLPLESLSDSFSSKFSIIISFLASFNSSLHFCLRCTRVANVFLLVFISFRILHSPINNLSPCHFMTPFVCLYLSSCLHFFSFRILHSPINDFSHSHFITPFVYLCLCFDAFSLSFPFREEKKSSVIKFTTSDRTIWLG